MDHNTINREQAIALFLHGWKQSITKRDPEYCGKIMMLEGPSGIGKTALASIFVKKMNKWLKKQNINSEAILKTFNLAAKDPLDFSGMPVNEKINNQWIQFFSHPSDLPRDGYGVILFDEANRILDQDMKSTLLSLLQDRQVNGNKIGDGYQFLLLGNPSEDEDFETHEFDFSLKDRIVVYNYKPTVEEILSHFKDILESNLILEFLNINKDLISLEKKGVSPRTWQKVMKYNLEITKNKKQLKENYELFELNFKAHVGYDNFILFEKFLDGYKELGLKDFINGKPLETISLGDTPLIYKLNSEIIEDFKINGLKNKDFIKKYLEYIPLESLNQILHDIFNWNKEFYLENIKSKEGKSILLSEKRLKEIKDSE